MVREEEDSAAGAGEEVVSIVTLNLSNPVVLDTVVVGLRLHKVQVRLLLLPGQQRLVYQVDSSEQTELWLVSLLLYVKPCILLHQMDSGN